MLLLFQRAWARPVLTAPLIGVGVRFFYTYIRPDAAGTPRRYYLHYSVVRQWIFCLVCVHIPAEWLAQVSPGISNPCSQRLSLSVEL